MNTRSHAHRRTDTPASPAGIPPSLDTEGTLDPHVEDPQTSVLASVEAPSSGREPGREVGEAHLAASRTDQWTLATSRLGLAGAVMPVWHGPGPLSAEGMTPMEGLALHISGVTSQLRLPWSSLFTIQLLQRSSDGRLWMGEFPLSSLPQAGSPELVPWDPSSLPRHFWTVAELTPNRLRGSSASEAEDSLLRLGVVRGYAELLKIRLSVRPASLDRSRLIARFRLAQALNGYWTHQRKLNRSAWDPATLSQLAQRVLGVLYSETLCCAEVLDSLWPTGTGEVASLMCDLADLAGLDLIFGEVDDFCNQSLESQADFLAAWGVDEVGHASTPSDPAPGTTVSPMLLRSDVRPLDGTVGPGVVSGGPPSGVSTPPRSIVGRSEKLHSGYSVLSAGELPPYSHISSSPKAASLPPPPHLGAASSAHSISTTPSAMSETYIAELVAAEVSKRLGSHSGTGVSELDYDAQDLQHAPDKVRQGLQLLQAIGEFTPRERGAKPMLVRDVPLFQHKQGDVSDATGNIIKHLNLYDLQATRANASYSERARDLDMGAFLSESSKELHTAMKKTLPVYQHTFAIRAGETTQDWERRMYMRAIRLMLAAFHAHKPEFRLLQEIAAVNLSSPQSSEFIAFSTKIFQLYTQLGIDQRTRGQYFNAILGGLMRCGTEAFKHDGPYWAGRFRDKYANQTELARNDISRRIAVGSLPDTASSRAIPIVIDEQNTNTVVDMIRDEMEQNEHAQVTWGTDNPGMIQHAVVATNRLLQSGCSVCGMRNHQAQKCFCADKDGRLDLHKVAERKAPWSVLGHARKNGSLSTLSEEAFAQRKLKLEEILAQSKATKEKSRAKGKPDATVMRAELAVLQETYQKTADRLASTQAELASVRQAHIMPSTTPLSKPSIPGQVARVTALDGPAQVRQVAEESLSPIAARVQAILSEHPADTSGVPGLPLPELQQDDTEVALLTTYLATCSRAKGHGRVEVHRSHLYHATLGVFASRDMVYSRRLATEDAIGKISGETILKPKSGGVFGGYTPTRCAAVWANIPTAQDCVQLICSSDDQHGIWVNDPLDESRENCTLVPWSDRKLATPSEVFIVPCKPLSSGDECYIAHGVERWVARFAKGEFSTLEPMVQVALWERVCTRYGSVIANSLSERYQQGVMPLFWGALEPQFQGRSDWYARPLLSTQSYLAEYHSYGQPECSEELAIVDTSDSEDGDSASKRRRIDATEHPRKPELIPRVTQLIDVVRRPLTQWIPAPSVRISTLRSSCLRPAPSYSEPVEQFLDIEYWSQYITAHCQYRDAEHLCQETQQALTQLDDQIAIATQRQKMALQRHQDACAILTSALEAVIATEASVRMTTNGLAVLTSERAEYLDNIAEASVKRDQAKLRARTIQNQVRDQLLTRFGERATRSSLTPILDRSTTRLQPVRLRDVSQFRTPLLPDLTQRAASLSSSIVSQLQHSSTSSAGSRGVDIRVTTIDDGTVTMPADQLEEQLSWIQSHAVRTEPRDTCEWVPRDYLGSNQVLIHAWVHLRGLDDRLMFNPRTQEWKPIDTTTSPYPTYKCIANLDPGSATTLISMHTARQLQCPIHQNCDALSMKGVQGSNFEAGYHCTVLIGVIGVYWDPDTEQYREGAYEMVVQALILPTLSVPILIGNQALRDHHYSNVAGSLDFSFGELIKVECKAVNYDIVRQHCCANTPTVVSSPAISAESTLATSRSTMDVTSLEPSPTPSEPSSAPTESASSLSEPSPAHSELSRAQAEPTVSESVPSPSEPSPAPPEPPPLQKGHIPTFPEDERHPRPKAFPRPLWKYVSPKYRKQAIRVFARYSTERLEEVLNQLASLDIFQRDTPRGQRTWAQAYYNLDAYFHPVADEPPVVLGTEFTIETSGEIPRVNRHKRFSAIQKASLEARVRRMMRQGQVQPSKSPISLGIVLVEFAERIRAFIERHGDKADAAMFDVANEKEVAAFYRFTVDLRPINEVTIPDMFPLPRLLDLLDSAFGSLVFSITDLEDAFFTIALALADRYKTAFSTHNGHYEFCVMPQGARNAANVWARHVSDTFAGVPSSEVMVYQDDISAHASNYDILFERMQLVYDRVNAKRNVLKLAKTHLDYPEITFLGHVLNGNGRRPCPKKTAAIRELAMPQSVKDVQCFLGMLTFYRDYIPAFARLATPLYGLLKKGVVFTEVWGPEHEAAITETKRLLTSYGPQPDGSCSVLRLPDFNDYYRLHIDAAKIGTGLGAVLLQQDHSEVRAYRTSHPELAGTDDRYLDIAWHPVAYWSKSITGAQKLYSATELETMALHHAILHFHAYLQNGREFEVITDHKALVFMINRNFNINNTRLARYALDLQGYYFRVTHRDGVKNMDADAVSRLLRRVQSHGDYLTRDDLAESSGVLEYTQEEREFMETEAAFCHQTSTTHAGEDVPLLDQFILDTECRNLLEPLSCHMLTRSKTTNTSVATPSSPAVSATEPPARRKVGRPRKDPALSSTPGALESKLRNPKRWKATYSREQMTWNGDAYVLPDIQLSSQPPPPSTTVEESWDADISDEELLASYQYLVQRRFRGTDGLLYEVLRLSVDPTSRIALAYTKDLASGQEMDTALPLFGDNGVIELVERNWVSDSDWPESELAMYSLQEQDPVLSQILTRVLTLPLGSDDPEGYFIPLRGEIAGVVQHGPLMRRSPKTGAELIVVPQVLRETLLRLYHEGWAHPGAKRMYDSLRLQYHWPGLGRDVRRWVGQCHACHLRKPKAGAASPPLQVYDRLTRPFERVHIDLTGPLPITPDGFDYILVFKCALTKWVEIFPIQSKAMERVVECFVDEIYCRHGAPSQIVTDRGTEFVNRVMRETCKLLRIKKISTTPGNPQSDGMVERQMGTLKDALYHYVNAFQDDWDNYLPVIAHAYRTTVNVATGFSPFYLLYGREARQPHDQWIRTFTGSSTLPEYVKDLAAALTWSWDKVGDTVVAEATRQSRREQIPHKPKKFREYRIGELIYLARVPRRTYKSTDMARAVKISGSLQARFCGPYRIVGKWNPVLYKVEVNGKIKTVHALKMKSAGPTTEPTYDEALHRRPASVTEDFAFREGGEPLEETVV